MVAVVAIPTARAGPVPLRFAAEILRRCARLHASARGCALTGVHFLAYRIRNCSHTFSGHRRLPFVNGPALTSDAAPTRL
jgi:hypothetical protein